MSKDSSPAESDNRNDPLRGLQDIARVARLDQIRRSLLATAEGIAYAVLNDAQLTGIPAAPLDLRALAQRLFIETARVWIDLEAGSMGGDDKLAKRIQRALATLSGEATHSNQTRELRRAVKQVAKARLAALEDAERAPLLVDPERPGVDPHRRRETPADVYRSVMVEEVMATVGPELARRLTRDGHEVPTDLRNMLLDALRATKPAPYKKKKQRQVDAMQKLLRAIELPESERSMKGRDR